MTNRRKLAVIFVLLIAATGLQPRAGLAQGPQGPQPDMTIDAATRAAVIDSAIKNLNEAYVFPEVAKKIVWAHMDAMTVLKNEPETGIKVLQHYNDKMDPQLIRQAYATCSWQYPTVPRAWIETLAKWEREDNIIQRDITYEEITDFSMRDSYPGYPAWPK